MKKIEDFKGILDLALTFNTEEKCSIYIAQKRWGDKPICPHCGECERVYKFSDNIYFKCASCRLKFTVRVGTIFEGSKIPLTKWFAAIYLFACRSKGVSSLQLSKDLKITQKSAWFMLHRLRYGMANPAYQKPLENLVEADETYIGGKEKNRHMSKRSGVRGQGAMGRTANEDKTPVFGIVERKGQVRVKTVENVKKETLEPIIIENVKAFARVITDEWYAYNGLNRQGFLHETIKHALKQYVNGEIHTNTIENFWSILKRNIYGIYHFTSKKHLQKYLEEVAYRFNNRKMADVDRFNLVFRQSDIGKLEYKILIENFHKKHIKE